MPDWFYRTLSQPVLFRLPAVTARDFALGFMGSLARLPFGPAVIDFLGHLRADPRLQRTFLGITFPAAVGLGPGLDERARALPALARFGFGFLEIGPVTAERRSKAAPVERRADQQAIWCPDLAGSLDLETVGPRLAEASRLGIPIVVRLGYGEQASCQRAAEDCRVLVQKLAGHVHLFSLSTLRQAIAAGWSIEEWSEHVRNVLAAARSASPPRPVVLCVPADADDAVTDPLVAAALAAGVDGLLVDGCVGGQPSGHLIGPPAREPALRKVLHLREYWGKSVFIMASGGIHEPRHALELRAAGAELVEVDTGLVYSGPGLPKRINDAFLFADSGPVAASSASDPVGNGSPRPAEMAWFWTALLGSGMLAGSLLTLAIAATRVVLPYDEAFVGMSREELQGVNPRLLSFMAHDRVTLAGTMVAIGLMYIGLSLYGVREGLQWARQSILVSAFTGFATFFLFLGFGYLDPLHALVTAILLQFLLLAVHSRLGSFRPSVAPLLHDDWTWRYSLWGQLILIVHACLLLAAGLAISAIGVTQVFVHEDLEFMQTTAEALGRANPRLVPLVAHDRATFGGMLLASGWVFLLPALWGYGNDRPWLWWTFLLAGLAAYAAAIGVHFAVGYTDLGHLLPAFAGLAMFLLGLALSYPYLCGRHNHW